MDHTENGIIKRALAARKGCSRIGCIFHNTEDTCEAGVRPQEAVIALIQGHGCQRAVRIENATETPISFDGVTVRYR